MLINANTLINYKLNGNDGEIGHVKEFYFDDNHWTIRYLIADTGNWLFDRLVLISPYALADVDKEKKHINLNLSKKQIEESPLLSSDKPVSKQFEENYYKYYGWPVYWGGPYMWGHFENINHDREQWVEPQEKTKVWDPHLRSTHDVTGHAIQASDGEIGHVDDFILDEKTWAIRYIVVDTTGWLSGKKVLISPHWIDRISWEESKVFINLTKEMIKASPEYTDDFLITRSYETGLHKHYNRPGYWHGKPDSFKHTSGEKL
ncbi:MAG TPA: PRC-barrel domain-containing protein [bacterium]|nr:PRC-barrel domain-containing protein [bacterium]